MHSDGVCPLAPVAAEAATAGSWRGKNVNYKHFFVANRGKGSDSVGVKDTALSARAKAGLAIKFTSLGAHAPAR